MPDGVAEQLADDENRVADGSIEDSRRRQVGGQALTGYGDARRCARQEHCPRCSHLPAQAAWNVRLYVQRPAAAEMPRPAGRKPAAAPCARWAQACRLAGSSGLLAALARGLARPPLGGEAPDKSSQTSHQPGPLVGGQLLQDPSLA